MGLPPGPSMPRPAQTAAWVARPGPFMMKAHERYGDVFTIKIGTEPPWVVLAHPEGVREVFKGDPEVLHAGKANAILRPFLGRSSVLLLDGPQHLRQRKLMLPPFHGARMAAYKGLVAEIAREHIASWPRGETITLAPRLQAITLDVVLRVIFGVERGARLDELRARLTRMTNGIMGGPSMVAMVAASPDRIEQLGLFKPWVRPVDKLLFEQIADRRAQPGEDVLSLLLAARTEAGEPLTETEVRDELMTLLVAGHETTATALAWTAERLTHMPGGWEKLRAGGEEYAEAAGKEALRLKPVLPVVVRHLQRDATIAGLDLEAGTVVAPCIYLVHRRADVYPDPLAFRPERFLGPDAQGGTYTWIPFGGGIRRCLGAAFALMELRIVLSEMAGLEAAAPAPASEPTSRRGITMVPARGAEVVLS